MFVHCCHCTWCQRETGSAFALNVLLEADVVEVQCGTTEAVNTPTNSGAGQVIHRCPTWRVALWSQYSSADEAVCFLRSGTLDAACTVKPNIHIFRSSKQPWVVLPVEVPAVEAYYNWREMWPSSTADRYASAVAKHKLT